MQYIYLTQKKMQQNRSRVFECNEGENKFSLRDDKGKTRKVYYKK